VSVRWQAAGATHVGRLRRSNEDNLLVESRRGLFLVADGMGGHAAGEVASEVVTRTVGERVAAALDEGEPPPGEALEQAVLAAHEAIVTCCRDDPRTRGMGTTLTCALLDVDGTCRVAHIGDSRLYLARDGALAQLTRDHTWVQQEVDAGRLSSDAARQHALSHILTRVLSDDLEPEADYPSVHVHPGDLLLLCSDGLYNMVPDAQILEMVLEHAEPEPLCGALIRAANRAGGADNVTVVVVRVEGPETSS
jgi:PPM family protein phosphatase